NVESEDPTPFLLRDPISPARRDVSRSNAARPARASCSQTITRSSPMGERKQQLLRLALWRGAIRGWASCGKIRIAVKYRDAWRHFSSEENADLRIQGWSQSHPRTRG